MAERSDQPRPSDVAVAIGSGAVAVGAFLLLPALAAADPTVTDGLPAVGDATWWVVLLMLTTQSAVLAWRLIRPEAVAAVVAATVPLMAAAGPGPAIGLTSVALLVAVYTLATQRAPSRVWPLLTAISALVAAGHCAAALRDGAPVGEAVATGLVQAVVLVGAPLVVAAVVVTRRESRSARDDKVHALEREHEALVAAAVARERTAMARELHDIAAHHLTGIAVMSAAIAIQIDTDPSGAKTAVGELRRQSTAVLRDLRSLVGLLRDDDDTTDRDGAGASVRVESLAGVPSLVSGLVASGQDVGLVVLEPADGRPLGTGIGPLAQLAAYRTVQESLANARRHAPDTRCEVEVDDRDPAGLVVTVRNTPSPRPPEAEAGARGGLGLVGMQERAELTGSHLTAGPTPDGGWQVLLRTPRPDAEEPT